MFQGFPQSGMEFFMAIRFNNNREFFLENRGWYEEGVRTPARRAGGGASAKRSGTSTRTLRPGREKVVSRINRDVRFSNDKSPYRDYIWAGLPQARRRAQDHAGRVL